VGAVAPTVIINMSMQCGFSIGFMAGAGAATADILYAILASVMGTVLTTLLEPIALPLRIISGLLLIGLAGSGLWHGVRRSSQPTKTAEVCEPLRMYAQFVGLTMINPLTVIYFTAFILGRAPATAPLALATPVLL
jgi:threonine/homoserine/homoserine lactone efflux protein